MLISRDTLRTYRQPDRRRVGVRCRRPRLR